MTRGAQPISATSANAIVMTSGRAEPGDCPKGYSDFERCTMLVAILRFAAVRRIGRKSHPLQNSPAVSSWRDPAPQPLLAPQTLRPA